MSTLSDVIISAFQELLELLFSPITTVIEDHAGTLLKIIVGTPHPNAVFAAPTNDGWPEIYTYYWDSIIPLALFLWAVSIGLVIFFESTSHLFSSYHRTKLKKRAFSGLLGVLAWWWIAALSLQFMDALTGFLVPDLSSISLFETLSFSAMGVLGLVVSLSVDLVLFILIALIYFTRQVVLYLFVLLMPLLIVLWVPGVGPFGLVSGFVRRLAGFYVPFLFMTVPVALLFRLGELLGSSFDLSMSGIGAWLIALVIPIVAVVSPFVLFWQAGAIFFVADRAAYHTSRQRATGRAHRVVDRGRTAAYGGGNFGRGLRGQPARRPDGQYLLGSGRSRAHAVGTRLNAGGSRLHTAIVGGDGASPSGPARSSPSSRATDFAALRDRGRHRASKQRTDRATEERPPYIY